MSAVRAELIEDDGESRYKITDIIGKLFQTKYFSAKTILKDARIFSARRFCFGFVYAVWHNQKKNTYLEFLI